MICVLFTVPARATSFSNPAKKIQKVSFEFFDLHDLDAQQEIFASTVMTSFWFCHDT